MMHWISRLHELLMLRGGGVAGRSAQVKEEPAKRAGDTEQSARPPRFRSARVFALGLVFASLQASAAQATQVTSHR